MAGKFKYADPELLNPGIPTGSTYTDPVKKAIGVVAPTGQPGTLPPINTIDDALSFAAQVKAFPQLVSGAVLQEKLYGKSPEEIMNETMERDDRGILGKSFDYITKPFRYETSVMTAPVVAALKSASTSSDFSEFLRKWGSLASMYEQKALANEMEYSVYDALKELGMSNWGAIPLGIGADILLSPSTYLGVGGLTRLGRLAQVASRASKAGRVIDPASKIGLELAELSSQFGPDAAKMLQLGTTAADQARLGQRALVKFMGKPIIEGAGAFEKLGALRDMTLGTEKVAKAFGTRPAGVTPDVWETLKELDRSRRGAIGLRAKDTLTEIEDLASKGDLSEDELKEVFYSLARSHAPAERLPWDKLTYSELSDPTMYGALKEVHPGLKPKVVSLGAAEFKRVAAENGLKGPMSAGKFTAGDTLYLRLDPEMGAKSWKSFEEGAQAVEEGKNLLEVLPEKTKAQLSKVYGADEFTPELSKQFGEDWEKFLSGNDRFLSQPFMKWVKGFTESDKGWKKVPGIFEVELPSGDVKRIVGDLKFVNESQEALRQFAKKKFQELLSQEKGLGILNKSIEDYVPMIYEAPVKKFSFKRAGKVISQEPFFAKSRQFKNIEEAERFGHKPVENILELIGIREMKNVEATEAKRMLDEATDLFGIVNDGEKMSMNNWDFLGKAGVNPENKREVAEYLSRNGYVPMKVGKTEVFFQPEIHQFLNRLAEPFTNEETLKGFLRSYDRALNVWKGYVTAINPKFHARNFVSNVFLLYLKDGARGLDPFVHKQAMDILMGKPGEIITKTGTRYTYDDIFRLMNENGVLGSGFMGGELKSAFRSHLKEITKGKDLSVALNPLRSRNIAIETGRKFGTNVENEAKAVGFLNDLIMTDDAALAAKRTFEHLYDYMDLTNFEKNFAKRLVPFYTWMSKNIPLMVKKTIMEPGKIMGPMAKVPMVFEHKTTADLIGRNIAYPKETVPPFIKEQGAFPVGVDEKGRVKYYVPGLPYMDIARLSRNELASSLTPILKPISEWFPQGGYSIFMDRPYEQYAGQMVEAPLGTSTLPKFLQEALGAREEKYGTYMPGKTAAIINTLLPMLRTPQKLLRALQTPGEGEYTYPSELVGQKFMPVDPAMERKATMYDWLSKIEGSKKVERGIERHEGKRAVDRLGSPLPLNELIRLHALKYGPKGTPFK